MPAAMAAVQASLLAGITPRVEMPQVQACLLSTSTTRAAMAAVQALPAGRVAQPLQIPRGRTPKPRPAKGLAGAALLFCPAAALKSSHFTADFCLAPAQSCSSRRRLPTRTWTACLTLPAGSQPNACQSVTQCVAPQVERCCLVSKKGHTLTLPPRSDRTQEVTLHTHSHCLQQQSCHGISAACL